MVNENATSTFVERRTGPAWLLVSRRAASDVAPNQQQPGNAELREAGLGDRKTPRSWRTC